MFDVPEYRPGDEKIAVALLVIVVLMVVAGTVGYCIGLRNIHNNGSGVESIGNQIGNAESTITDAAAGIHAAQGHADQVGAGIADAKEQAGYIHSTATTSAGIIAECQQIIAGIRNRGKTDASPH